MYIFCFLGCWIDKLKKNQHDAVDIVNILLFLLTLKIILVKVQSSIILIECLNCLSTPNTQLLTNKEASIMVRLELSIDFIGLICLCSKVHHLGTGPCTGTCCCSSPSLGNWMYWKSFKPSESLKGPSKNCTITSTVDTSLLNPQKKFSSLKKLMGFL